MKKVLILCDAFIAPSYVPRVTNLCKNLLSSEWRPTLCSEQYPGENWGTNQYPAHLMSYYTKTTGLHWAVLYLLNTLFQYKDYRFERFITRKVNIKEFDAIICSTFNLFPLTTAHRISRKYNVPLLVDLRDIAEQWGKTAYLSPQRPQNSLTIAFSKLTERINLRRRNRVLRHASAITSVSPWHKDFLSQFNTNTHLIYNGYDKTLFQHLDIEHPTFDINFSGRIYDFKSRNPELLLQTIREMHEQHLISPDEVRINWYIDNESHAPLRDLLQQYNVADYNHIHHYIPTTEVPHMLNTAAINLLLTNNTQNQHGIVTTKIFEYIGVEKPILCIPNDHSLLEQIITETQSGIATDNVETIKQFILHWLKIWRKTHKTHINIKNHQQYTRQAQALQFIGILDNMK